MKKIFHSVTALLLTVTFLLSMIQCSEEHYVGPVNNDEAPAQISGVEVTPLNGAARISYQLPDDPNLRYVKAIYEIRPGVEKESISSLYTNSILVDGFSDEKEYTVKLYTVSYGEKVSANPVTVKVTPLISPLNVAYNSFTFTETFGGITVRFENNSAASLAVILFADSLGGLREVETYYTKSIKGQYSMRGFSDETRLFGAVIRDRWGNTSDTITQLLTPLFEQFIPKDLFQQVSLPTDTYEAHITNGYMYQIWDDRIAPNGGIPVFHTKPGSGMPQWFTFDMGRTVQLSRYKFWHRGGGATNYAYALGGPRRWEIWGSADAPDPTGSWDGWTKLMDCESYKPSGPGPATAEDLNYATNLGEDFDFPEGTPPVRYIRMKTLETWGLVDYIYIQELSFWGRIL